MACNGCSKIKQYDPEKSGLQYSLAYGVTTVEGRSGKVYPIASNLITKPHTPRGGWSVVLWIHGQRTVINGLSARDVFYNTKKLLELNSFEYTDLEIWFNLNIQWLENAVNKYQNVVLESLLNLAQPKY